MEAQSNLIEILSNNINCIYNLGLVEHISIFRKYIVFVVTGNDDQKNNTFRSKWKNVLNEGIKGYYYFNEITFETDGTTTIIQIEYIFNKFSEIWKYIKGPFSLSEHFTEDNKHIYIFGDSHEEIILCSNNVGSIDFIQFVKKTVKYNKNKVIDIFVEIPYGFTGKYNDIYLERFFNSLKQSKFKNLRLHYTDMRTIEQKELTTLSLFKILRNKETDIFMTKMSLENLIRLLESSIDLYTFDFIFKMHDINKKILKQIMNVKEPTRTQIATYFREIHKPFTKWFVLSKLKEMMDELNSGITRNLDSFRLFVVEWESIILDIYVVSRMFREFKRIGHFPQTLSNILVYVGEYHARSIRGFLDYIKAEKINDNIFKEATIMKMFEEALRKESLNCVDITTYRQPFFYINPNNFSIQPDTFAKVPLIRGIIFSDTAWVDKQKEYLVNLSKDQNTKIVADSYFDLFEIMKSFSETLEHSEDSLNSSVKFFEEIYKKAYNSDISNKYTIKIALLYYYSILKNVFENSPKSQITFFLGKKEKIFMYENDNVVTSLLKICHDEDMSNDMTIFKVSNNRNMIFLKDCLFVDDQIMLTAIIDSALTYEKNIFYNDISI